MDNIYNETLKWYVSYSFFCDRTRIETTDGIIPVFGYKSGCSDGLVRILKWGQSWEEAWGVVH